MQATQSARNTLRIATSRARTISTSWPPRAPRFCRTEREIERLEQADALLEQPGIIRCGRTEALDEMSHGWCVRRFVPLLFQIDVVHDFTNPPDGHVVDAE